MADFLTKRERSHRMSLIRGKHTKPEERLKAILDDNRIKHDRHRKDLPGNPDFVVGKVAIFVDGVFWHGRDFESWRHKLSKYWKEKITSNIRRDNRNRRRLRGMGWRTIRFWETDLKDADKCVSAINRACWRARVRWHTRG